MLNYEAVLPALFGVGWGLVGLCLGASQICVFTAAMLAGMGLRRLYAGMRDGPVNRTKEKFS